MSQITTPIRAVSDISDAVKDEREEAAPKPVAVEPPSQTGQLDDEPTPVKLDRIVEQTRANAKPGVTELRRVKRLSVKELNELDMDEVRERFEAVKVDDRGPVQTFFDFLDGPRNAIMSTVFSGIEKRKRAEGDTNVFGTGRVMFSDILGEMGMRPGIIRGVLGFVGDVVTDPLTYVGGSGVAARVSSSGSKASVAIGRQGLRSVLRAAEQIKRGQKITDDATRAVYEALSKSGTLTGASAEEDAAQFVKSMLGDAKLNRRSKAGRVLFGLEEKGTGSLIPEAVIKIANTPDEIDDATKALKSWVDRYGMGAPSGGKNLGKGVRWTPKGVAFGQNAGSQVAHIPFTEFGVYVPSFTRTARGFDAVRAMAREVTASQNRNRVSREMKQAFGGDDILPVVDAYAAGWAAANGKSIDDYYAGMRVVKGGTPGSDALKQSGVGEVFYRGDPSPIGPLDVSKAKQHGISMTKNRDVAKSYGEHVSEYVVDTSKSMPLDGSVEVTDDLVSRLRAFSKAKLDAAQSGMEGASKYSASDLEKYPFLERDGKVLAYSQDGEAAAKIGNAAFILAADLVEHLGDAQWMKMAGKEMLTGRGILSKMKDALQKQGIQITDEIEREFLRAMGFTSTRLQDQIFLIDESAAKSTARAGKVLYQDQAILPEFVHGLQEASKMSNRVRLENASVYGDLRGIGPSEEEAFWWPAHKALHSDFKRIAYEKFGEDATLFAYEGTATADSAFRRTSKYQLPRWWQKSDAGVAMGSYEVLQSGERVIRALTNPNASTLPHEVAHDFMHMLPSMDPALAERAAKALGAADHASMTVEHQEAFARGFEAYLREGNAPNATLRETFEKFKKWLTDIYKSIVGTPLENKLNPELRKVFDEMLNMPRSGEAVYSKARRANTIAVDAFNAAAKLEQDLVTLNSEVADARKNQAAAVSAERAKVTPLKQAYDTAEAAFKAVENDPKVDALTKGSLRFARDQALRAHDAAKMAADRVEQFHAGEVALKVSARQAAVEKARQRVNKATVDAVEAVMAGKGDPTSVAELMELNKHLQVAEAMVLAEIKKVESDVGFVLLRNRLAEISEDAEKFNPEAYKKIAAEARKDFDVQARADPAVVAAQQQLNEAERLAKEGLVPVDVDAAQKALDDAIADATKRVKDEATRKFARDGVNLRVMMSELSDAELEQMAYNHEAIALRFKAAFDAASVGGGTMRQYLGDADRELMYTAKALLGLGPDAMGEYLFAAPTEAFKAVAPFVHWARRQMGTAFGMPRNSAFRQVSRNLAHIVGDSIPLVASETVKPFKAELNRIASTFGLNTDEVDQLIAYVGLRMHQIVDHASGGLFYATRFDATAKDGSGGPSRLAELLSKAQKSGIASNTGKYKGLREEMEALAVEAARLNQEAQKRAFGARLVDQMRGSRVPLRMEPTAKQYAQSGRYVSPDRKFQQGIMPPNELDIERQTDQIRFLGSDGKTWHRVFRYEVESGLSDEERRIIDMLTGSSRETREMLMRDAEIAEFNKVFSGMTEEGKRGLFRPSDPYELNELQRSGRFATLLGSRELPSQMFSTDPFYLVAQGEKSEYVATATKEFAEIANRYAMSLSEKVAAKSRNDAGATVTFLDGTEARVLAPSLATSKTPGLDELVVEYKGERYRTLRMNPAKLNDSGQSLVDALMETRGIRKLYPEPVAQQIEQTIDLLGNTESQKVWLQAVDEAQQTWKMFQLGHPAWTVFNVVSAPFQMAAAGINPLGAVRFLKDAIKALLADGVGAESILRNRFVEVAGRRISYRELLDDALQWRMVRTGSGAEAAGTVAGNIYQFAPDQIGKNPWKDPKGFFGAHFSGIGRRMKQRLLMEEYARSGKKLTKWERLWYTAASLKNEKFMRSLFAPWFAVNSKIEDAMRLSAYMQALHQGDDAVNAARRVREGMYDMLDLSPTEMTMRRYVFPFYSWMRNNLGYQAYKLLTDPKYAAVHPKLKAALEEAINGEEVVPEYMRPRWMREQLGLQIGTDPDSRSIITLGTALPVEAATRVGPLLTSTLTGKFWEGFGSAANYFVSSVNPVGQLIYQLGTGRETFTGREIGYREGEGDIGAGEFFMGQIMPRAVKEVAGVPGSLRRAPLEEAASRGFGAVVARTFLAGRSQPFSDERIRFGVVRDFKKREQDIRKGIAVAEREGREEQSIQFRARLMALYKKAMQSGLPDLVPVWAKAQLAEMSGVTDGNAVPTAER